MEILKQNYMASWNFGTFLEPPVYFRVPYSKEEQTFGRFAAAAQDMGSYFLHNDELCSTADMRVRTRKWQTLG